MRRCLYCYKALNENEQDFHATCSKKIFGQAIPPELPYTENKMEALATQVIKSQMTVTGVQPKLSLHLTKGENKEDPKRFTIGGLWGGYILKPRSIEFWQGRANRLHDRVLFEKKRDGHWRISRLSP